MESIQSRLHTFTLPTWNEIPDVGLYLDQVTKYINGFFMGFPEMKVTPSMISNYVKLKIVSKPEKKVYSREQIAYFIFIVLSKTVLSMENIKKVFSIQKGLCSAEEGYTYFQAEMMNVLKHIYDSKQKENTKNLTEEKRMVNHIVIAIAYKIYLEKYFEVQE